MSVSLYLLNKKGYLSLQAILKHEKHKSLIDKVITASDKGNKEDHSKEIIELCLKHKVKVFKKNESFKVESEYLIAIGWRWLINDSKNLIVIHDSILPRYRGFSPLPNMLINGEKEIGATAIFANEYMDEGDVIFSEKTSLEYPIHISNAIDKISQIYISLVTKVFSKIINNETFPREIQDESKASYSIWRDEKDYFINWSQDASSIERFINAVGYPYDGAKSYIDEEEVITINKVKVVKKYNLELPDAGKILTFKNGFPIVTCGKNAIQIIEAKDSKGNEYEFKKLRVRLK